MRYTFCLGVMHVVANYRQLALFFIEPEYKLSMTDDGFVEFERTGQSFLVRCHCGEFHARMECVKVSPKYL